MSTDPHPLGTYLRARRALVTPEQAGLPDSGQRRVSGLRREEVALLAGISADYYLRLERGRDTNPSPQVLESLARVLRLDEVERDYLLSLGQPQRRARPRRRVDRVPPRLHHLLATLDLPAFVEGPTYDVLASNPLAVALNPRLRPGENRLRSLLLDPEERELHEDWEQATAHMTGAFRGSIDAITDDARVIELVGELSLASARFRELWARHDVRRLDGGTARLRHPVVGPLELHRDKLPVEGVLLVVYYPEPGTDSAERLAALGSLSTPSPSSSSARAESLPGSAE